MMQARISVTEQSQPAAARRTAIELAKNAGLDETTVAGVALIVTELGTNLVKHAINGELLMRRVGVAGEAGVEILSLDKGPGIQDIGRSLQDGFSTRGTSGTGLGSVRRKASNFDIYSQYNKGTAIVARIMSPQLKLANHGVQSVGVVHQAIEGETICGDDWIVRGFADGWVCAIVDGLGHGFIAAEAATPMIEAIRTAQGRKTPVELIEAAHLAARHTRGAAMAVAVVDTARELLTFAGIGNIAGGIVYKERQRHLVSHHGIVGHQYRNIAEFTYPWSNEAALVLHSDGIRCQWDLSAYPGLLSRDSSLIAGVLFRDFTRERDDATIVVVKDH